ncbi:hypothetical protein ONS96_000813 [Cadophora gregata f. sp. sojae]|nr:hypothetical protein ONS96_000813 [Cadophora gregata f. sp. sojae]
MNKEGKLERLPDDADDTDEEGQDTDEAMTDSDIADDSDAMHDILDNEEEMPDDDSTGKDDLDMPDGPMLGSSHAVDAATESVPINAVGPDNAADSTNVLSAAENTSAGAVDLLDTEAERAKKKAEHEVLEQYARKHFSTLEREMNICLEDIIKLGMVSRKKNKSIKMHRLLTAVKRCQIIQKASAMKYANATEGRRKSKKIKRSIPATKHPKTTEEIMARISGEEELNNPWSGSAESAAELPEGGLLMRVTDEASRAKLYPDQGFLSGGFEADLKTAAGRRAAMELHLNWSNRQPTAFISTTGSAFDFIDRRIPHMEKRDGKKPSRYTVKLTYINANVRQAAGLPTLRVKEEIARYKVGTPQGREAPWFRDEYIIPFRVGPEQIVATHCLIAVKRYMRIHECDYYGFHKAVVLPAFAEHEAARREGRPVNAKNSCVCWHCCDSSKSQNGVGTTGSSK